MARARNYFAWQARLVGPELGQRVLEVGCGTGNFTGRLLDRKLVVAVDIEEACVRRLLERFPGRSNLRTLVSSPGAAEFGELARFRLDSCVCLNVLEHIEGDAEALRRMGEILVPGGKVVLMLPAFPALFGPIDRNLGHYRRYTRRSVRELAARAGMNVSSMRFMNAVGFFGWWANARLLRRKEQSAGQIEVFDKWMVPALSKIEARVPPPFGQSLIVVLSRA